MKLVLPNLEAARKMVAKSQKRSGAEPSHMARERVFGNDAGGPRQRSGKAVVKDRFGHIVGAGSRDHVLSFVFLEANPPAPPRVGQSMFATTRYIDIGRAEITRQR